MADFLEAVAQSSALLDSKEEMLGKGLNIPNNATNSGPRKIMNGTHQEHALVLSRAETPYIQTGYENRFGERSSSIIKTDDDYEVVAKIAKFSYAPNHHYWLIVRSINNNNIDIIERISYHFRTETYGYLHNNSIMDWYSRPGTIIPKGETIRRSTAFDSVGNRTNGLNLNIAYMALDDNMEDSVVISESCHHKLSAPLLREVSVTINENDIPLNLYGDDNIYKSFPDIGEDIKDGILLAYRREKREESIYTQAVSRLQEIMMSDDKITVKGKIIDISIYCNNPDHIKNSVHTQQFLSYYEDRQRMNRELVEAVSPLLVQGGQLSPRLDYMYEIAKQELDGVKFEEKRKFSNILIKFVVMEDRPLGLGDKVADRYGGKGVVSKILPDNLMPRLSNGMVVDMIKNSSTMYNRENAGQIFELETNYISMGILDYIRNNGVGMDEAYDLILRFLRIKSPLQAQKMELTLSQYSYTDKTYFLESILSHKCIIVSNEPMSETMTIYELERLKEEFPWIKPTTLMVPIKDSTGNYRYVNTRRTIIAAPQYCLRLKQFAEEKFSATALSSTNITNENAKSKASKNYREPHSNTPIKFGYMESGDMNHMGAEFVVINLMLHSLSPHGRRLVEQAAIGDPYNVDIKLDTRSKNRSAEKLTTRLKTMGYRMVYKKKRKQYKYVGLIPAVKFINGPNGLTDAVRFVDENCDVDAIRKAREKFEAVKKEMGDKLKPAVYFIENQDELFDQIVDGLEHAEECERKRREPGNK